MKTFFDDVGEFHQKLGFPHATSDNHPRLLWKSEFEFRTNAMFEELREFIQASERESLADALDSLVDLTYFVLGTAQVMGLPFNEAWKNVHAANMRKRRWQHGDPVKVRSEQVSDAVKPVDWQAPDLENVIITYKAGLK